ACLPKHPAVAYLRLVSSVRRPVRSTKILLFAIPLMLQGVIAGTPALDHSKRGVAKIDTRYIDDAIADFDRALQLDPKDATAYINRGLTKQTKGDLDGAVADYNRALELNPKDAIAYTTAYNARGLAKQTKGDLDGAVADYNRVLEL